MEKSPIKISIIITNHERKKYVKDAIISVVNTQEFSNKILEIILVKDYSDEEIEKFAHDKGVINIDTNEVDLGKKLELGILKSRGEIICFLDDDDMYHPGKLSFVTEVMSDRDVIFVHNDIIQIAEDDNYDSVKSKSPLNGEDKNFSVLSLDNKQIGEIMKYRTDWYLSSMVIRGEVAKKYANVIGKCKKSLDKVIFLLGVKEGKSIVVSEKQLTFYRKHISITGLKTNLREFNRSRLEFTKESLRTLRTIESMDSKGNSQFKRFISLMRLKMESNAIIYGAKDIEIRNVKKNLHKAMLESNCKECKQLLILLRVNMISNWIASYIYMKIQTRGI
ncbi:glycosyltransferase family 2 protein [Cuniculiplasma sp. SKW3]|uniref:glycosyltransferase family 2 protein n=1 Tax=Cuniculiplasma sp. SKW3 TaxID=3400170 RepID=UPI003FD2BDB3